MKRGTEKGLKGEIRDLVRRALAEDLGLRRYSRGGRPGDVTTELFVPKTARVTGRIVIKAQGVLCGTQAAVEAFKQADPSARVRVLARDGARVRPGQAVLEVSGGRGILTAERTALNILQRLSGVARPRPSMSAGGGRRTSLTRKTIPGMQARQVRDCSARRPEPQDGLHDAILIRTTAICGPQRRGDRGGGSSAAARAPLSRHGPSRGSGPRPVEAALKPSGHHPVDNMTPLQESPGSSAPSGPPAGGGVR